MLYCGVTGVYLAYLMCMSFAVYPGREPISTGEENLFDPVEEAWKGERPVDCYPPDFRSLGSL